MKPALLAALAAAVIATAPPVQAQTYVTNFHSFFVRNADGSVTVNNGARIETTEPEREGNAPEPEPEPAPAPVAPEPEESYN